MVTPAGQAEAGATLGTRIRQHRLALHLSQANLALTADLATKTVVRVERGKHQPVQETIRRLAEALNVPVELLTAPDAAGKAAADGNT